jgi:hypothetical protein
VRSAGTLEHRIFHIKNKPADEAVQVAGRCSGPDGSVTLQPRLRTVTVTDERPASSRIERAILEFDTPPRRVNVAVQLLVRTHAGEGPVPRDLRRRSSPGIDRTLRDALGVTSWNDAACSAAGRSLRHRGGGIRRWRSARTTASGSRSIRSGPTRP